MKLCSYETQGRRSYGVQREDGLVVDLRALLGLGAPPTLEDLIEAGLDLAALAPRLQGAPGLDPATLTWLPPLRRPGKIIGVAINNRMGQAAAFRPFADPAFFFKPSTSLVGHGQPVVVRGDYGLTHPEPELAVVIGKAGRAIPEDQALSHVFGYAIINDITSPGLKEKDSIEIVTPPQATGGYSDLLAWRQVRDADHARSIYLTYHARSKGSDTFGPMGPWLVTADEIADPNALPILSYDGDELVFEDSTANLTFSVQRIIAHVSAYMTLEPGDIIHCGTAMKPAEGGRYRTLTGWDLARSGRPMAIEIPGLGRLVNPVVVEP
ncbi:fumarylacetoacetate hydrolase family protein [Phenylobacterium conjunctum]|uniref:Fumarylacetoacetate hydrolase family protein n=1 Tax=Phenylobacterium conjunctum TaxID=1298959 RepID=A0ABW3T2G2_9CAUL